MKNFGLLLLAAVIGSGLTLGVAQFFQDDKTVLMKQADNTPVVQAKYAEELKGADIPGLDFTVAAEKSMPAVVHIKSTKTINRPQTRMNDPFRQFFDDDFFRQRPQQRGPRSQAASGSGVIISEDGYIVTNNHVIDESDALEVSLYDNTTVEAEIIGVDPTTDLAVIKIDKKNLKTMAFSNSDDVRVGEWVVAVGNPFNLNSTVTAGIVSAKARNINIIRDRSAIESFIQTDAAVNPGNSGGALVNLNGDLIGINTAIASPTGAYSGYAFAVPSNLVNKVVKDLIEYGAVQRGYLGVMIRDINSDLAKEMDLDISEGVLVDSMMSNSAAEDAGLKSGDVIVAVDGEEIKTAPELQEMIGTKRPGEDVEVTVVRKGKEKTFDVTLKNKAGNTEIIKAEKKSVVKKLGISVKTLDSKTKKRMDLSAGVVVDEINDGLLRKHTNMREGFIITKMNGQSINSQADIQKILDGFKGGLMIEGYYEDVPGKQYYAVGIN